MKIIPSSVKGSKNFLHRFTVVGFMRPMIVSGKITCGLGQPANGITASNGNRQIDLNKLDKFASHS
jgi:hypothetical protein